MQLEISRHSLIYINNVKYSLGKNTFGGISMKQNIKLSKKFFSMVEMTIKLL